MSAACISITPGKIAELLIGSLLAVVQPRQCGLEGTAHAGTSLVSLFLASLKVKAFENHACTCLTGKRIITQIGAGVG